MVVYLKYNVKFTYIFFLRVYFQDKNTKLVVYWDYTSKCTKNTTTSI